MTKNSITEGIQVCDFKNVLHIAMAKQHSSKYIGVLECEGKPLHGKELVKEVHTPVRSFMKFGKPKVWFYINEKDSPIFTSIDDLVLHYHNSEQ
ncbi:MAG: hypothetical protein A2W90_14510 [Bacteroidetes bacterium GWF2_42_66]|nr:MAG: hypothetical protein A2W92_15905 [Bacteroidetes bacterium GWA2_42_15]OFX99092.1 MAG: hypothetical protein A2W89_06750 [Bacteroidetes bacterium GWE2_42_39]OFY46739.1 MAG: hypothetical protein A2W90_14510 [Bacteroidetes bacterium GWF2_42_66]HAZ00686.1 hypothetical protein [Marinilabiliales bacterium]HBL73855.1 hypothetical protein [Prolixibacteraceae bacterium]